MNVKLVSRGGATLCTRHAHSKYIIDNRMFTIQFFFLKWTLKWTHLVKKLLKLNVNLFSCLNLFSIWDILNFMIAMLVYKYCQQYLYKKKCTSIVIFTTQIMKNWGGFFKVNCGVMNGDLMRLKEILEALWLIYVILKRVGKVSTRFYKIFIFNVDRLRTLWMKKKDGDKISLSKIADDHI